MAAKIDGEFWFCFLRAGGFEFDDQAAAVADFDEAMAAKDYDLLVAATFEHSRAKKTTLGFAEYCDKIRIEIEDATGMLRAALGCKTGDTLMSGGGNPLYSGTDMLLMRHAAQQKMQGSNWTKPKKGTATTTTDPVKLASFKSRSGALVGDASSSWSSSRSDDSAKSYVSYRLAGRKLEKINEEAELAADKLAKMTIAQELAEDGAEVKRASPAPTFGELEGQEEMPFPEVAMEEAQGTPEVGRARAMKALSPVPIRGLSRSPVLSPVAAREMVLEKGKLGMRPVVPSRRGLEYPKAAKKVVSSGPARAPLEEVVLTPKRLNAHNMRLNTLGA